MENKEPTEAQIKQSCQKRRYCSECGHEMFFDENISWGCIVRLSCKNCGRILTLRGGGGGSNFSV